MSCISEISPAIRITSFSLSHDVIPMGEAFEVHITAESEGKVAIGSYVVRISHPVERSEALPGFDLYKNHRAYISEGGNNILMDNGELDLDPGKGEFGIRINTAGWPEGVHYLTIFAHNRPQSGPHIMDYHNFSASVRNGKVSLEDLGGSDAQPVKVFQSFSVEPKIVGSAKQVML